MSTKNYLSPRLEITTIEVEQGIAVSPIDTVIQDGGELINLMDE